MTYIVLYFCYSFGDILIFIFVEYLPITAEWVIIFSHRCLPLVKSNHSLCFLIMIASTLICSRTRTPASSFLHRKNYVFLYETEYPE